MEIISNPTEDEIKRAAKVLKDGHLVAFPTETVYGLGADANNENAVARIYSAKGRPSDHPLIVHVSSMSQLEKWAINIPDFALKLAEAFWPGPMTLILNRSALANNLVTGGQKSVGLRIPSDPICRALLNEFEKMGGQGVAAPSANRFGAVSPTNVLAVVEELGEQLLNSDLLLDGGQCQIGLESTIFDCTRSIPYLLRPGAITKNMISAIGVQATMQSKNELDAKVSGSLDSHYSPKAKVILNSIPSAGDGFMAMSGIPTPKGVIRLASPKSIEEFAEKLYVTLRQADHLELKTISVRLPPNSELGEAVIDRLMKASFPKLSSD
jgi:L-threonylcarbamoyladenylate synthase